MKRRKFLKAGIAATAGTFGMPYLLPSGRLFAKSAARKADHVVVVMFAGGVRQQDAVLQRYLAGSQNEQIEGNILYNLLDGAPPTDKIVYGEDGVLLGQIPIPSILSTPLQNQGTLFPEMQATLVGHYGGLNVILQGNTITNQGLRQRPLHPTIFEYLRRHAGIPASKVWFVGNSIGNSIPLLHYSLHEDYGSKFGANFLVPNMTFSQLGFEHLANAKNYHPEYELSPMYEMQAFLDATFQQNGASHIDLGNTEEERWQIKEFIRKTFTKVENGIQYRPPVADNSDLFTIGYACEVLQEFEPNLTVLNLSNVDNCHGNFTSYLKNLHRADHGVGYLWDFIQTQIPNMADNTIMIVIPECGRNLSPNPIQDANDWYGYDHNDANSRRIFGLMAGPTVPQGLQVGSETNPVGFSADVAPTVADIFGIKDTVMNTGLLASGSASLFDRI
ncbi:hypothetical protein [Pontibacter sp. G13]|uniref:hypothetical protein n=1 Tax=Pontibacter sp. G13 TaxID=3074898 RepID=UPI00288B0FF6|nr:hypothetical protein [Pontibacter sp. G13]WNJ19735.1 hypothetical protein RJD25_04565 [Pontibacter sp. G13]